jgi:hypothetical protein
MEEDRRGGEGGRGGVGAAGGGGNETYGHGVEGPREAHIYTFTYTHISIYVYICTHTHTHTHTHVYMLDMARLDVSSREELIVEEELLGSVGFIALVVHVCTYRYILPLCGRHFVQKKIQKKKSVP